MASQKNIVRGMSRLLLVLVWVLPCLACVRLIDHGDFTCGGDDDCPSGQKCQSELTGGTSRCIDKDSCRSSSDCSLDQRCANERCKTAECTSRNEAACGDYACEDYTGTCARICYGDSGCRNGTVCDPAVQRCTSPLLVHPSLGQACSGSPTCGTGECCLQPTRTCQLTCSCTSVADCAAGELCCPQQAAAGSICQKSACASGQMGDACHSDTYCVSGYCFGSQCAQRPAAVGAACLGDEDCASSVCCASATDGKKTCKMPFSSTANCAPLIGDACTTYSCPQLGESYCRGSGGAAYQGFCSAPCLESKTCGFGANGLANTCVLAYAPAPSYAEMSSCRASCLTNDDCSSIDLQLKCYGVDAAHRACDYSTLDWVSDPVP